MKKLESTLLNMAVVLTGVAVISGGLLAAVNEMTAPQIEKINAETLSAGIQKVMGGEEIDVSSPDTIKVKANGKEKEFIAYAVTDKEGKELGHAIQSSESAFGGELRVLTGFATDGTILGYTILQSSETPGLGAKAGVWFQKEGGEKRSVVGKNPGACNFWVSKDDRNGKKGDIDAITASTITSRAFLNAILNAYNQLYAQPADAESGASK